uniref:TNFR-Cys domain-containing protein n=1 Tax=Sparus aurata TaxID=8175 RepID=A0A671YDA2_SPAAU
INRLLCCTGLMRMEMPCTDSNNAVCFCNYNHYFDTVSGQCTPCTVCPAGQGVYAHCEHNHDTVCEECEDDTYSDRESSLDPCLPCTICEDDIETLVAEPTANKQRVTTGQVNHSLDSFGILSVVCRLIV